MYFVYLKLNTTLVKVVKFFTTFEVSIVFCGLFVSLAKMLLAPKTETTHQAKAGFGSFQNILPKQLFALADLLMLFGHKCPQPAKATSAIVS